MRASVGAEIASYGVRKMAYAKVIIARRGRRAKVKGDVTAGVIDAVDIFVGAGGDGTGVKIRPTFAHAARLRQAQARTITHQTVRQAVRQFVPDDVGVQRAVAVRRRVDENKHLHTPAPAVGRRTEIGVISADGILRFAGNTVGPVAAAPKVIALEITRRFGKTGVIKPVMVSVGEIEKLRHHAFLVIGQRRAGGWRRFRAGRGVAGRGVVIIDKFAGRAGGFARRVNAVCPVAVNAGLDVVAVRHGDAVGQPT